MAILQVMYLGPFSLTICASFYNDAITVPLNCNSFFSRGEEINTTHFYERVSSVSFYEYVYTVPLNRMMCGEIVGFSFLLLKKKKKKKEKGEYLEMKKE